MLDADHIVELARLIFWLIVVIVVVSLIIYVLSSPHGLRFKYDHKNKMIEYSQEKLLELQNKHIEKSFNENRTLEKFNSQPTENIISYYDNIKFNDSITNWIAYKEGVQIISNATIKISYAIRHFITSNGLGTKTDNDIEILANKRAIDIIGLYDLEFKKSDIKVISGLTLKKICGAYYSIIETLLYRCYKDISYNHIKCLENIKAKEALYYKENPKATIKEKMESINNIRYKATHSRNLLDDSVCERTLTKVQHIIIGIFHDMLEKE